MTTLSGGKGADTLKGGAGSDSIGGGKGTDTAVFDGDQAEYSIVDNGGGSWMVTHVQTGDIDTLTNIEILQFDDGDLEMVA